MQETLRWAIRINPDFVIFNITTPYPGTEMFDWAKANGLSSSTEDWDDYDLSRAVMKFPALSPDEVNAFYRYAYRRYYFRPGFLAGRLAHMRSLQDLVNSLQALRGLLGFQFSRSIK